jgi:uncharacterized protein YjiS (DUF1127 family)
MKGITTMSGTIPLPVRAALQPHELLARTWALPSLSLTRPSGISALLAACRGVVRDVLADWRDRRQIRTTRLALMNLDDATLRDIGFVRSEVESVAAEAHGAVAVTRARLLGHAGSH